MLILYIATAAFVLGGVFVLAANFGSQRTSRF